MASGAAVDIEFSDWSGGDAGRSRPIASQGLNTYRGINTWRYPSGAIGPRPPLLYGPAPGLPVGVALVTYTPLAVTINGALEISKHFVLSDKSIYRQKGSAAVVSLGSAVNPIAVSAQVGEQVVHVPATVDGGELSYHSTNTLTDVATMPWGQAVAPFGQTVVILQNTANSDGISSCIIRFSDPNDVTTWPAPNSRFVGFQQRGFGLLPQRNALVVPKETGEMWTFTGVLGPTDTLRQVDFGRPVRGYNMAQVVNQSNIWWTDGANMAYFNGAQIGSILRPDFPPAPSDTLDGPATSVDGQVIALDDDDDFIVVGLIPASVGVNYVGGMVHRRGAWDRIRFPDLLPTNQYDAVLVARASTFSVEENIGSLPFFAVSPVDGSSASVLQYGFLQGLEFPYFDFSSVLAQGGTASALAPYVADGNQFPPKPVEAELITEEWWAPEGKEVSIESVTVDFSWQTSVAGALGAGQPMHQFDIQVDVVQPVDQEDLATSTPQSFVPTVIDSSPDGFSGIIRARQSFDVGDQQAGGGFRVRISNWRGIMIHRIICHGSVTASRG